MSMILVEVSALKLDKDRSMAENIAKQIAGCSSEEETGHADEDASVKEVDLITSNLFSIKISELSDTNQIKHLENHGSPRYGNYEIFCPPPEA
ncbi:MAG: hypothetical protein QM762_20360 [Chryseolinea sp.]